jgi:hypothetical protein
VQGGDGAALTYELADARAVRAAVAALLAEVRRIRFVGDAKAAAALADSFRSGEARWQREIEARYRQLERPRCAGFSFPRLVPSTGADGRVEKLRVEKGEGTVSGRIAVLRRTNLY